MQDMMLMAGWSGYPLLLAALASGGVGLVALGLAAAKAWRPALVMAGVAVGVAFVGVLGGQAGYLSGLRGSYKAVAHAAPADRATILAASEQEAKANVTLGLFSLPGGLLAALAAGVAFARTGGPR